MADQNSKDEQKFADSKLTLAKNFPSGDQSTDPESLLDSMEHREAVDVWPIHSAFGGTFVVSAGGQEKKVEQLKATNRNKIEELEALRAQFDDTVREVGGLKLELIKLQLEGRLSRRNSTAGVSINSTAVSAVPETVAEMNERLARIDLIIEEISAEKNCSKRNFFDVEDVRAKVIAKINRDRASADSDVYRRNQAMLQHLLRRQEWSLNVKNQLNCVIKLLTVAGDFTAFDGKLFDRDYLDPKSDKYYKYVAILVFLLKYQRLAYPHATCCFRAMKERDTDDYFFQNWN
jgi:hypothetical protein